MWYGNLFQSKGTALWDDLSPYVFNFVRSTWATWSIRNDKSLSGNCVLGHVALWSKEGEVYILSFVWLAGKVVFFKRGVTWSNFFLRYIILAALFLICCRFKIQLSADLSVLWSGDNDFNSPRAAYITAARDPYHPKVIEPY